MPTSVKIEQGRVVKVGDGKPDLVAKLLNPDGTPKDLSNADAVRFYMRQAGTSDLDVDSTATVVSASQGKVKYNWADDGSDLSAAGEYKAEFEVEETNANGVTVTTTYPGAQYIAIEVIEGLK